MRLVPVVAITAAALAAFTGALLVTHAQNQPAPTSQATPMASAVRTAFPGLAAASSDAQLPSLQGAHPPAGTAVQASGPFDDRFTMTELAFTGARVTATVRITSDVSDILEFEALAGFYDARGHLLGTAPFTLHHSEADAAHGHTGPPIEVEKVTIAVPGALRSKAVSAAIGVPVLVNE